MNIRGSDTMTKKNRCRTDACITVYFGKFNEDRFPILEDGCPVYRFSLNANYNMNKFLKRLEKLEIDGEPLYDETKDLMYVDKSHNKAKINYYNWPKDIDEYREKVVGEFFNVTPPKFVDRKIIIFKNGQKTGGDGVGMVASNSGDPLEQTKDYEDPLCKE